MAGFISQLRRYWDRKTRTIRKNDTASPRRQLALDALEDRNMPAPLIGATKVDTLVGDANNDGNVDPGDTIQYNVTITNSGAIPGADDAQGVTFDDVLDPNTTLGAVNVSPLARDDVYTAAANTQLLVGNPPALSGPSKTIPGSATLNDSEFLNDTFTVATFQTTSAHGGTVSMVTSGADIGSFRYVPALDFNGTDTFTYTLTDAGLDGNFATPTDNLTSVGTVTIIVGGQDIWYVDSAYAGGNGPSDGSSTRPFTSLAAVTGTTGPDDAGDIIYVSTGNGNYDGNMTLLANQTLWGQAEPLVVDGVTLRAAGPSPTLTNTSGTVVTLGTNNTLKGFNVGDSLNTDVAGTNFGTLTVRQVALFGTGRALSLNTGTLAASFISISSQDSSAEGLALTAVGGSLAVTAGTTITNPNGAGISVQSAPAGASFSFGNTSSTQSSGAGVDLANNAGSIAFADLDIAPDPGATSFRATNNTGAITSTSGTITGSGTSNSPTFEVLGSIPNARTQLAMVLDSITSTDAGATGVNLVNVSGNLTVGTTTVTNSAGRGIEVQNAGAGTLNFGDTTVTGAGQIASVRIGVPGAGNLGTNVIFTKLDLAPDAGVGGFFADSNSGTFAVRNGTITTNGANGISLTNNASGTFNFTGGGLVINTDGGIGFNATGGGTVSVQGSGNTINSVSSAALNVVNTTIGAAGLTLQSIFAGNNTFAPDPSNGITLNNTGTLGHLTVTGTGTEGSGGTILNTTGDGIILTSTQDVTLSNINVTNNLGNGILGNSLNGIILNDLVFSNNARSTSQAGILINELTGDATHVTEFIKLTVRNSFANNVRIVNTGGNLTNLLVTGSTFSNDGTFNGGGDEFIFESGPAGVPGTPTMKLTAIGNLFIGNNAAAVPPSRGLSIVANDGTINAHIGDGTLNNLNLFSNNVTGVEVSQSSSAANGTGGNVNFDINANVITSNDSHAINVFSAGDLARTLDGFIRNNVIGSQAIANSGSRTGAGIRVEHESVGVAKVLIDSNTVQNIGVTGVSGGENITVAQLVQPGVVQATITNNTLRDNANNRAISINATQSGAVISADVHGNAITNVNNAIAVNFVADGPGAADGTINVPQANAAAISAANGGTTVSTDARVFFGQASPLLPNATPLLFAPVVENVPVVAGDDPIPPPSAVAPVVVVTPPVVVPVSTAPTIVDDGILSQSELESLVGAAIARWEATDLTAQQLSLLHSVVFNVENLPGWYLGEAIPGIITLDTNAAGNGWFIDSTPFDDNEFTGVGTEMVATANGGAAGRVDALTTLMHELGHQFGLDDTYASADSANLMYGWIQLGERRLAATGQANGAVPNRDQDGPDFLFTPINIGNLPAGKSVTIVFRATVNNPFTGASPQVSNQGTVKFTGGPAAGILTDDPSVGSTADPTVTPIDLTDVSIQVANSPTVEDTGADLVYTFTRDSVSAAPLTVRFTITGTTASDDYVLSGATFVTDHWEVVIPANQSSAAVTLNPTADTIVEPNETAILTIIAGTGYEIGTPTAATGTILNDDFVASVAVAVTPTTTTEDTGADLVYTFSRSAALPTPLTVNFSITGTSASNDYVLSGATFVTDHWEVVILANLSSAAVTLNPTADNVVEPGETVILTVLAGSGYTIGASSAATGTIVNDDADVTVAVAPTESLEDTGPDLVYTFTRTGFIGGSLIVNFNVSGTAKLADNDFTVSGATTYNDAAGSITFDPGSATKTLTLNPTADTTGENDETVVLSLTTTANAGYTVGSPGVATATIKNDDIAVSAFVTGSPAAENGGTLTYTFTRTGDTGAALAVNFSGAGAATFGAGNDYIASSTAPGFTFNGTSGTITIPIGQTSATMVITALDDLLIEGDENVLITATPAAAYSVVGTPANGVITDDDATTVSISKVSDGAESSAAINGTFRVTLTKASSTDTVVNVSFGGTASSADFTASNSVTIMAGNLTADFDITVINDRLVEGTETVQATLVGANNPAILIGSSNSAILNIIDNDTAAIAFQLASDSVAENTTLALVGVQLTLVPDAAGTGPVQLAHDVSVNVNDVTAPGAGKATPGSDYTFTSPTTVTFSAGVNYAIPFTTPVSVGITNDNLVEADETLNLQLTNLVDTSGQVSLAAPTSYTLTIQDDDSALVSIAPQVATGTEAATPTGGKFRVTQSQVSSTATVIAYTVGGSATAGNDYTALSGSVTIPAGSLFTDVDVSVLNDALVEGTESVIVTLSSITSGDANISIDSANKTATVNIADNDTASLAIAPAINIAEQNGMQTIPVTLTTSDGAGGFATLGAGISLTSGVVDLHTGTAIDGTDYSFAAGQSVTFNAGDGNGAVRNVMLTPINNGLVDGDRTVKLKLQPLNTTLNGQASLGNTDSTVTIKDDDVALSVVSIDDGDADNIVAVNAPMTYTITFNKDVDATTVDASDFDNAAGAGAASITIGAITETGPTTGVFTVVVTPTTTGTLILRIKSGAIIKDPAGNALTTPVTDNDTVQVLLLPANVSGTLFVDYDADVVQDANEAGLPGRTVFLDKNNDGVAGAGEPMATTGAGGVYSFAGVTPGSYTLRLVTVGFEQGVGANGQGTNLVLNGGDTRPGVNLGMRIMTAVAPLPVDSQVFAGSISDDDTALVEGYYHAIFGRAGDASGVSFWASMLHSTSRQAVIQAFLASDEFRGLEVQRYYQVILGRAADSSEIAFWVGQMRAGLSSSDVAIAFLISPEFTAKNPSSQAFVESLYRVLLSREGDTGGVAAWTGLLDSGQATRTDVIRAFFNSDESRSRAVDATYPQLLQRPADAVGRAFYLPNASTGAGLNQIFVTLLSSQEFFDRRTI